MPARQEKHNEVPKPAAPKDAFGDLGIITPKAKNANLKGKDMFTALSTPEKKSLKDIKPTSPKPQQASDDEDSDGSASPAAFPEDPFGTSMPFGTSDPFVNDPFASTTASVRQGSTLHDAFPSSDWPQSNDSTHSYEHSGDPYNIPLPQEPPPPLPQDIASYNVQEPPPPPPRPKVHPPSGDQSFPPLPPRPKSNNSLSSNRSSTASLNSISESHPTVLQKSISVPAPSSPKMLVSGETQMNTPPVPPPRPGVDNSFKSVPRPRPRASKQLSSPDGKTDMVKGKAVIGARTCSEVNTNQTWPNDRVAFSNSEPSSLDASPTSGANFRRLNSSESQKSSVPKSHNSPHGVNRSSSVVADPFVAVDPFGTDDPFTQSDPFANDPFAPDPFSDLESANEARNEDPFTTIVASPRQGKESADPFAVFDNKFSNESFKFDRSSSKKGKSRASGKTASYLTEFHFCLI